MSLIKSREMIEWDSLKSIRLHLKIKVYKITTNTKFTSFDLSLLEFIPSNEVTS